MSRLCYLILCYIIYFNISILQMPRSSTLCFFSNFVVHLSMSLFVTLRLSVHVCLILSQYPSISFLPIRLWRCVYLILGHWALTLISERLLFSLSISGRDGRLRRSDCCRCQSKISSNMTLNMCSITLSIIHCIYELI